MKKSLFLFVVLFVIALTVNAQREERNDTKPFAFGFESSIGLPTGDLKQVSNMALVLGAHGEYRVAPSIKVTLNASMVTYYYKKVGDVSIPSTNAYATLVGAKYYFVGKFYGHAQGGLTFFDKKSGGGSALTYAPAIGYSISKADFAIIYQAATKNSATMSFIGVRVGYSF